MNNFSNLRTALSFTILLVFLSLAASDRSVSANYQSDEYDITGGWHWEWTNAPDYTKKDCPGGNGKITVTFEEGKRTIAFIGKAKDENGKLGETIEKKGSWNYLGRDPNLSNRRKYEFVWSNGKDTVVLSDNGNFLRGDNGVGCTVTGRK